MKACEILCALADIIIPDVLKYFIVRDRCEVAAADKKLAGAAKTSFTGKCLADGLQPYCAEQAAAKKLAGAAKNSFMKKCQAGN